MFMIELYAGSCKSRGCITEASDHGRQRPARNRHVAAAGSASHCSRWGITKRAGVWRYRPKRKTAKLNLIFGWTYRQKYLMFSGGEFFSNVELSTKGECNYRLCTRKKVTSRFLKMNVLLTPNKWTAVLRQSCSTHSRKPLAKAEKRTHGDPALSL